MPAVYLAGKKAICTIDGAPLAVEEGSWNATSGVDETTNLNSGGYYEDIDTVKSATLSIRAVYDGNDPPEFDEGDVVAISVVIPGSAAVVGPPAFPAVPGGPSISGNFRITSMSYPIINPKVAVKYSFEANSQGAYVKGISPAV